MGTPRATGRARPPAAVPADTTRPLRRVLPDPLTADIDDALDAELLATVNTASVPELERPAASATRQGELSETDAPALLGRAFQQAWTGRLVITTREAERTIFLDGGRPVFATSSSPDDRLAELLRRQGRIDAAQRARVARTADETGRRTGAVLVDLGLLKPAELLPLLRRQHEEIILATFAFTEGGFRFHPEAESDPRRARLLRHPAALVAEGVRRGHPQPRMRRALAGGWGAFALDPGAGTRDLCAELGLDGMDERILGWLDGRRTLEQVVRESGLPEEKVFGLAYVLWCFGSLQRGPGGRGALDQRVERERILAQHALVQDADYFQVLGIGRDADTDEVVRAHRRLADELRPEKIAPATAVALAREIAAVRRVLAEALRVLGDETMRRSYRTHLQTPRAGATSRDNR
jgi:hypothetical protein